MPSLSVDIAILLTALVVASTRRTTSTREWICECPTITIKRPFMHRIQSLPVEQMHITLLVYPGHSIPTKTAQQTNRDKLLLGILITVVYSIEQH